MLRFDLSSKVPAGDCSGAPQMASDLEVAGGFSPAAQSLRHSPPRCAWMLTNYPWFPQRVLAESAGVGQWCISGVPRGRMISTITLERREGDHADNAAARLFSPTPGDDPSLRDGTSSREVL